MEFIADLREGQHVIEFYVCKEKQQLVTKSGKDYFKIMLEDRSGQIIGMIWDLNMLVEPFSKGDIVKVDGRVQIYQEAKQINIVRIRPAKDNEYDLSNLFRASRIPIETMYQKALSMIDLIQDPALKRLVLYFYKDNADIARKLKRHPAAKNIHHGYIGGLLEHSVSVATLALGYKVIYPDLDEDLLIAGGLLHDIGKLKELQMLPVSDYTDEGRLLGHISIGYQMVYEQGQKIAELAPEKLTMLCHMILSHHGKLEFASPVVPATMEAMALNMADLADSQLKLMEDAVNGDNTEGHWTAYNRTLERYLYKPEETKA